MDQQVAGAAAGGGGDGGEFVRPANNRCTEVQYIPLMAIIPRRDLYFAMKYWEQSDYRRVREGIEEEARRTLYISNLPSRLFQHQLTKFLRGFSYLRCGWQPGDVYAPVIFERLEEAARAYQELAGRKLGRSTVWLSWKIPNTIVYIMNIRPSTPSPRIHKLLQGYRLYGNLVRRPHMMIAAFRNPEEAEIAVGRLQGTSVDGELLQFSILRAQHASEFVGYDRSLSCYMCLRTFRSGAREMSITATPPLPLSLAVESLAYYELAFKLGENPQITLHDSQVLPAVTSRDIALRIRYAGHARVERGPHGRPDHFIRFMEILREDISCSGGMMDVGVVLEDPLDSLKVETFFGESVPPASRVIPEIGGELQVYHGVTASESSGVRENGRQQGNVLYSSAFNKLEPTRRASAGSTSDQPNCPGVNGTPLGKRANKGPKPHDSAGAGGLGGERVLPIGLTRPGRPSPGYPPPNRGGAPEMSAYSDPQPKVRQFPFSSTQPPASTMRPLIFGQYQQGPQLLPGGGQNTLMGLPKGSESSEKGPGDSEGIVEAMEDQGIDAPPEPMDGDGNGLVPSEAHIRRSSSDSASSSWSFLHRSYNGQAISSSSSSSAPAGSVGESVTQAFGQMHYTDYSNSEATESAPAEIVDLTVSNGKEGGRFEKSGNPRRARKKIPIVDSSDGDSQSELGSRAARAQCEGSTRKKKKSKRKEKVSSDEGMTSESGGEQPVVQRRRRKSGKKGKGKEIAHSDGSIESQSDQDEPGPSKPRKKPSRRGKISKQVESPSGYESPTPPKVEKKRKKKKKKAEEVEEVQEGSDVDMDASDPPTKRTRGKRRGRHSSVSQSEDAIQPLIEGISETHVAHGRSAYRPKPPVDTSSSDPKTKKRKRNRTPSPSPTPTPTPPPPPADLSPSPARPGESIDAAVRRREIEKKIHRINLQQHELSVRESGLKHELKRLKYQARVEADVQGLTYTNCVCSACGEYGHRRNNRARCKRHEKYMDWYPDR
ncbi:hypothetical protein HOY80DRAFT_946380 [Tuber brumale]|nr:hypothetical protein HOY80DRAFT_946380 [Tuber brumale]